MSRIVCKFGGSSLADAKQFKKVQAILAADKRRTIIVPSAPGKRSPDDAKLTDLLYLCQQSASVGTDFSEAFNLVRDRYLGIEADLGVNGQMADHLEQLKGKILEGVSRDYIASRGEYLNGLLMAAFLDAEFVDPHEVIFLNPNGTVNPESYEKLRARLQNESKRYVIPGFYGCDNAGQIKTFSRGGSDISGAIVARAINALIYENWTDVSGLLMADPRIIADAKPMEEATYAEIRELSYMGASVLHDEAIAPVREVGIPIAILNTNKPEHHGTRIVSKLSPEIEKNTEIAGIAGKKNFVMINIEKNLMNKEIGFAFRLFGILERLGISFEHCPSAIDSMSVILESSQLEGKTDLVMEEIKRTLRPDRLELVPQIALIAVVGEEMAKTIGIAAKVFEALRDAGVNVSLINQGASELNIIVGVAPEFYETALNALYRCFVKE
ncbi:aspartate kinase [Pseudobacteriovorax antillogorgiicola]|uniref:Aspartokinase n=1 Tax=Pseudobacteriovorax antillogorgiicola TaxID=1513793 RepID=A0A1Y6CED5_9BACT|nr:aspartate kinase [Pseudobacteriovorax antillogorgiicola]TCS47634.1 aspartate kinase [Pseudobacteriovorax antillogorgiicola]SMF59949.1 aspartate kinase [Pseudobacteriovorax antillogorgiicola]